MLTLTSVDFSHWLGLYFWPFVRLLALITTAPPFNEKNIPNRVRIGLALLAALLLTPQLTVEPTPIFSAPGVWLIVKQVLIGTAIGFSMQVAFATFRLAGEIIGMQIGLAFASLLDPSTGTNTTVLARFFNLLAMLLFLAMNGHLWLISLLADSFALIPINPEPLNGAVFMNIARLGGLTFLNGVMLALPMMTFLLLINMSLGFLNRITPQLSVFVVGFPITLLVGLLLLSLAMPLLSPFTERVFGEMFDLIAANIRELSAKPAPDVAPWNTRQ